MYFLAPGNSHFRLLIIFLREIFNPWDLTSHEGHLETTQENNQGRQDHRSRPPPSRKIDFQRHTDWSRTVMRVEMLAKPNVPRLDNNNIYLAISQTHGNEVLCFPLLLDSVGTSSIQFRRLSGCQWSYEVHVVTHPSLSQVEMREYWALKVRVSYEWCLKNTWLQWSLCPGSCRQVNDGFEFVTTLEYRTVKRMTYSVNYILFPSILINYTGITPSPPSLIFLQTF